MAVTPTSLLSSYPQRASSTFLPFLYETRTIRSPYRGFLQQRCKPCRSLSTFSYVSAQNQDATPLEPSTWSRSPDGEQVLFRKTPVGPIDRSPLDPNPIPFEPIPWSAHEDENTPPVRKTSTGHPNRPRHSRDSTITVSEQAIFDRIFADIASSKRTNLEDGVDEDSEAAAESFDDLTAIFDKAREDLQKRTANHQQRKERSRRIDWTPIIQDVPTLTSYTTELLDKAGWGRPGKIGSEDVSDLAEAHKQHRSKVERMIHSAQTDLEIWQILENEVFSLIHELNARIEEEKKAKKRTPHKYQPSQKYNPKKANEAPEPRPRTDKAARIRLQNTSASLPPTVLLSLLQTEYPQYLTLISRTLRDSFPSSPYALSLLPAVRRLGPISHVLGASTALYNETLLLLWNQEADLHGMADLLDEMGKQGVESNEVTTKFLIGVKKFRSSELLGSNGPWRSMWWRMGSVEEGWQRVAAGLERCLAEVRLKEEERRVEEREMEELEESDEEGEK